MSDAEQANQFIREVNRVIDHFRKEFDVNYATVIGCLEVVKADMIAEMRDLEED